MRKKRGRDKCKFRIRMFRLTTTMRSIFKMVVYDVEDAMSDRIVLGFYNAGLEPSRYKLNKKETLHWINKGAYISERSREMLKQAGIWEQRMELQLETKAEFHRAAEEARKRKKNGSKLDKYLDSQEIK